MLRYLAFTWNTEDPNSLRSVQILRQRLALANTWRVAFKQPGLEIYCALDRAREPPLAYLQNESGVVVGTLFRRNKDVYANDPADRAALGPRETADILACGGRELVTSYWGCYVAFLYDPARMRTVILRGPMSDIPCLKTSLDGVDIFFSRMEDCLDNDLGRFSINWDYLRAHLALREARTSETAIKEVTALEVGECVEYRRGIASTQFYWNPCSIAKSGVVEEAVEAGRLLRSATLSCVNSWASCHAHILHRLSGGLDSSIVLGCLNYAPSRPQVTCINRYSPGAVGDERRFARVIAEQSKCELIEKERDCSVNLEVILSVGRACRPQRDYSAYENHRTETEIARHIGASAIFCGLLGDNLFEHGIDQYAATEYVWRHGIRPSLLRVALDVAQRSRLSVWTVMRNSIREGLTARRSPAWSEYLYGRGGRRDPSLHNTGLVSNVTLEWAQDNIGRFIHPWFKATDHVPPGKRWMIALLTAEMQYDAPFSEVDEPPVIVPFCSQPLVETCLRNATYLSVHDGCDRAVARRAFFQDLPDAILRRSTKGSPGLWMREVILRNHSFIRELLLDGILVGEGLLDRKKVERVLGSAPAKSLSNEVDIVSKLYTEAWLRKWLPHGTTEDLPVAHL